MLPNVINMIQFKIYHLPNFSRYGLFLGMVLQKPMSLFLAVGEWLLILPRPTSLTRGFAQPLRQIARASSSPMLPNTVLTRSQLGMAGPGFEPTTLWLDIWSGFELHFWPHKSAQFRTDPTDPLQLSVRLVRTLRLNARAHTSLNSLSHPQISASH